jgi:endonuclease/exonuclease/phosphatase family metal-dependent hydrolase
VARVRDRAARHPGVRAAARTRQAVFVCALIATSIGATACTRPRAPLQAPAAPSAPTLAIVTWNMHAGRGDVTRLRYDLASGVLTGGVPADYILLLQEDIEPSDSLDSARDRPLDAARDRHSARETAATNGLSFFFAPVRGDAQRTSGNAILSTRPLLAPRIVTLERERQPRSAIAATIRLDSAELFVVNVHLENRLVWWRTLFSDTARARQATALLRDLPQQGDGILGGDLNTWLGPREPAWTLMLQRFPDTPRDPPEPTFHDRLVLDHLFFDLPTGWTVTRRVLKDSYGSDHHPVVASIAEPGHGVTETRR